MSIAASLRSETIVTRLFSAAIPALLAIFLGGLTYGVMRVSIEGPVLYSYLIRGFFGLLVGGIAISALILAVQVLIPTLEAVVSFGPRVLPMTLAERCPSCGHEALQAVERCQRCDVPLGEQIGRWKPEEKHWFANILILALGGGLLCLGAFVGSGPILENDNRPWIVVAMGALGLLLATFGSLLLWGAAVVFAEELKGIRRWTFRWQAQWENASYFVYGEALQKRGAVVSGSGGALCDRSLPEWQPGKSRPLTMKQLQFARSLIFLYERRYIGLWYEQSSKWHLGKKSDDAPTFTMSTRLMVRFVNQVPESVMKPLFDALRPHLLVPLSVVELWKLWPEISPSLGPVEKSLLQSLSEQNAVGQAISQEIGLNLVLVRPI